MAAVNDVNQVSISGRLASQPTLKTTGRGTAYSNFLLVSSRESEQGGYNVDTWVSVTIWGEDIAVPIARRMSKEQHVTVTGRLQASYDKLRGQSFFGITAEDVQRDNFSSEAEACQDDLNSVTIAGRLGSEAEYRLVGKNNDQPQLTFSIANSRQTDYAKEQTSWIRVVVWGDYARELSKVNLAKGQHVTVTGRLETRQVEQPISAEEAYQRQEQHLEQKPQRTTYGQVVASKVSVNDRTSYKRSSGYGDGAESFQHYSQHTSFDRYTGDMQTEVDGTSPGRWGWK